MTILDFVNVPSSYTIDHFHKMVAENGGNFSMNLNDSVTHCIAADKKGNAFDLVLDLVFYKWSAHWSSGNEFGRD